jgi:hypothetical protein
MPTLVNTICMEAVLAVQDPHALALLEFCQAHAARIGLQTRMRLVLGAANRELRQRFNLVGGEPWSRCAVPRLATGSSHPDVTTLLCVAPPPHAEEERDEAE